MPTRWRSLRRLVAGSLTVSPSNTIRPSWIGSSPLMQRSMVLLPEPERPMTAMISPASTESETRSSTVLAPKRLTTLWSSTSDTECPFQAPAPLRQREAYGEIDRGNGDVNGKGSVGRSRGELTLARQLDEADHRCQGGVLDELHEKADGWGDGDAHGLRHYDVAQLLDEAETERRPGLPLLARDRPKTAAPDFAQEGPCVDREGDCRRDPRRDANPSEDRQAEKEYEQPSQ